MSRHDTHVEQDGLFEMPKAGQVLDGPQPAKGHWAKVTANGLNCDACKEEQAAGAGGISHRARWRHRDSVKGTERLLCSYHGQVERSAELGVRRRFL